MDFSLYLITDRALVKDLPREVERALSAIPKGAAAVQLREKELGARELLALARVLLPICRAREAPLLVNDRLDVACAASLDGVHLTGGSVAVEEARSLLGPSRLIGASCHDAKELEARSSADFATLGPIFATPSKRGMGEPLGLSAIEQCASRAPALYALGGIDASNAGAARAAGARGVAAIRAWLGSGDPADATARLFAAVERAPR